MKKLPIFVLCFCLALATFATGMQKAKAADNAAVTSTLILKATNATAEAPPPCIAITVNNDGAESKNLDLAANAGTDVGNPININCSTGWNLNLNGTTNTTAPPDISTSGLKSDNGITAAAPAQVLAPDNPNNGFNSNTSQSNLQNKATATVKNNPPGMNPFPLSASTDMKRDTGKMMAAQYTMYNLLV